MRILVFQHVAVEHPGVFRDFWSGAGHAWHAVDFDRGDAIPPLAGYDLLVAMGGPMDVWQEDAYPWLVPEKAAIRRWVRDLDRPFLGICLGHQLLADALGGAVKPMAMPEVGLADVELTAAGRSDPVFAGFGTEVGTFQWHGAEVTRLPEGAVVLATNAASPVQAMRLGRHAYGFQYHCEITPVTVGEWGAIPAYEASLRQALGPVEADRLDAAVAPKLPLFREAARRMNDNLMALIAEGAGAR